jgi:hypothetical protein
MGSGNMTMHHKQISGWAALLPINKYKYTYCTSKSKPQDIALAEVSFGDMVRASPK